MNLIVSAIFLSLCSLAVSSDGKEKTCVNGTSWKMGCNTCFCNNGHAACTLMACIPIPERQHKREADISSDENEKTCVNGTTWEMDCNTCFCNNGYAACTNMACIPIPERHHKREADISADENEETCEEGTVWEKDCNTCTCMQGQAACTSMACIPIPERRHKREAEPMFHPMFRLKRVASADLPVKPNTYKEVSTDEKEKTCVNGTSWKMDCNTCFCNNGHAACTLMACIHIPEHHHKREADTMFHPMFRLKRLASADLPVKPNTYKEDCEPYDQWRDVDCNKCYCELDREATCSKLVCADGKTLEPTQGWQTMFNWMKQKFNE